MIVVFRIQPHVRLHEWVAEEHDFFAAEGLEYEFEPTGLAGGSSSVAREDDAPSEVRSGALEDMSAGRSAAVSCACHWAVNAAATEHHGRMYGDAYSVCPAGIYVAPGSAIREPRDLAGVAVGVGYHSGSHYSALQGLEPFLPRADIQLGFVGLPFDRVRLLLDGRLPAVNAWGAGAYVLEQRGCTKIVDTTFVMGFFLSPERGHPGRRALLPRPPARPAGDRSRAPALHAPLGAGDARRPPGPRGRTALRAR